MSRSILIRGVNWLGDAVMTTPALLRLREANPDARIVLLTPAKLADLYRSHPALDEVLAVPPGESIWTTASGLKQRRFQRAIILPNSTRSALEMFLAGIPERIGFAGGGRSWLLTDPVRRPAQFEKMRKRSFPEIRRLAKARDQAPHVYPPSSHHLFHYLELAKAAGADPTPLRPELRVDPAETARFLEKFRLSSDGLLLGLNPGAEYGPAKRWPAENFAAVAREMQRQAQCHWILFGGRADRELNATIIAQLPANRATNTAGETTLRELCAGLKACQAVLTNDTGPMHVAAALGVPVVIPFGSTSPELTGPGLPGETLHQIVRGQAACAPCFQRECPIDFRCMRSITPPMVLERLLQVLPRRL